MIVFLLIPFWLIMTMYLLACGIKEPYQAVIIPLAVIILTFMFNRGK